MTDTVMESAKKGSRTSLEITSIRDEIEVDDLITKIMEERGNSWKSASAAAAACPPLEIFGLVRRNVWVMTESNGKLKDLAKNLINLDEDSREESTIPTTATDNKINPKLLDLAPSDSEPLGGFHSLTADIGDRDAKVVDIACVGSEALGEPHSVFVQPNSVSEETRDIVLETDSIVREIPEDFDNVLVLNESKATEEADESLKTSEFKDGTCTTRSEENTLEPQKAESVQELTQKEELEDLTCLMISDQLPIPTSAATDLDGQYSNSGEEKNFHAPDVVVVTESESRIQEVAIEPLLSDSYAEIIDESHRTPAVPAYNHGGISTSESLSHSSNTDAGMMKSVEFEFRIPSYLQSKFMMEPRFSNTSSSDAHACEIRSCRSSTAASASNNGTTLADVVGDLRRYLKLSPSRTMEIDTKLKRHRSSSSDGGENPAGGGESDHESLSLDKKRRDFSSCSVLQLSPSSFGNGRVKKFKKNMSTRTAGVREIAAAFENLGTRESKNSSSPYGLRLHSTNRSRASGVKSRRNSSSCINGLHAGSNITHVNDEPDELVITSTEEEHVSLAIDHDRGSRLRRSARPLKGKLQGRKRHSERTGKILPCWKNPAFHDFVRAFKEDRVGCGTDDHDSERESSGVEGL